jgi:short-subunit dehydrogenase
MALKHLLQPFWFQILCYDLHKDSAIDEIVNIVRNNKVDVIIAGASLVKDSHLLERETK